MNISAYLFICFASGFIGIFLLIAGFLVFDKLTPNWNFEHVFKDKGISGGALVVSSFIIGLSAIIATAT